MYMLYLKFQPQAKKYIEMALAKQQVYRLNVSTF